MTGALMFPPPAPAPLARADRADLWRGLLDGIRVPVPPVARPADPARRERCRRDLLAFASAYCPVIFTAPNRFQTAFAQDLQTLLLSTAPFREQKALAAPRCAGKTTICLIALLWAACYRHCRYALLLCQTGTDAQARLAALKSQVLCNDQLAADFPELCGPVRDFGGDPRAAPEGYPWSTHVCRLANGVYLQAKGMDGAMAGALLDFTRPDLILVDDVETYETAHSETLTKDREHKLLQEVMPLVPRDQHSALLFICTIKAAGCLSDRLTDPKLNPEWRGQRWRALETEPERQDLWAEFMHFLRPGERPRPEGAPAPEPAAVPDADVIAALGLAPADYARFVPERRDALRFYVAHRADMDRGAQTLDPVRLPLWQIYAERAVRGEMAWQCEDQQNPPPEDPDRLAPVAEHVLRARIVGLVPGLDPHPDAPSLVPAWTDAVLVTVDVGARRCHWEVDAWNFSREVSAVLHAGISTTGLDDDGRWELERPGQARDSLLTNAVCLALTKIRDRLSGGFVKASGGMLLPFGLVDAGGQAEEIAWTAAVVRWCAESRWLASRGTPWGESYRRRSGERTYVLNDRGYYDLYTDLHKTRLYQALQRPLFAPSGELALGVRAFAAEAGGEHWQARYFAHHAAEHCRDGVRWERVGTVPNHWWDTAYMQFALADIVRDHLRASVASPSAPPPPPSAGPRRTSAGWKIGR